MVSWVHSGNLCLTKHLRYVWPACTVVISGYSNWKNFAILFSCKNWRSEKFEKKNPNYFDNMKFTQQNSHLHLVDQGWWYIKSLDDIVELEHKTDWSWYDSDFWFFCDQNFTFHNFRTISLGWSVVNTGFSFFFRTDPNS